MRLDFLSVAFEALTNDPLTFLALLALGIAMAFARTLFNGARELISRLTSKDAALRTRTHKALVRFAVEMGIVAVLLAFVTWLGADLTHPN